MQVPGCKWARRNARARTRAAAARTRAAAARLLRRRYGHELLDAVLVGHHALDAVVEGHPLRKRLDVVPHALVLGVEQMRAVPDDATSARGRRRRAEMETSAHMR
eukprot:6193682-Pleurochrysis_carterae.AAC.1